MRAFNAIFWRELKAYFYSPIAYVLLVGFLAITGYFFYSGVAFYTLASMQAMQNPAFANLNLQDALVAPLLSNMSIILMLITPLLTMRLLSEEKRSGTLELLLSYPLSDTTVVMAKFLAAWCVVFITLGLSLIPFVILNSMGELHWPAVLAGYLGLLLMGGAFVSLGILASSATENQIVSAVVAFAAVLLLWVLSWVSGVVGSQTGKLLKALSLGEHFQRFPQGLIDTADLSYFVLFIGFFLFVTIRTLEAKRWKA